MNVEIRDFPYSFLELLLETLLPGESGVIMMSPAKTSW
jgi:hypothetical protein